MSRFIKRCRKYFSKEVFSDKKFKDLPFIRSDIKLALELNNFVNLTKAQNDSLHSFFNHSRNLLLAETGSGKTLAYILPVVNDLYNFYQTLEEAEESERENLLRRHKGALILTANKELTLQIYSDFQKIDRINKLRMTRLGSISQTATFVRNMKSQMSQEQVLELSNKNLQNFVNFQKVDVVISTPQQMEVVQEHKRVKNLKPRFVVVDEADELFSKRAESIFKVFESFYLGDKLDPEINFIFCAASMPKKLYNTATKKFFSQVFPNIHIIQSESYSKINKEIDHKVVEVDEFSDEQKLRLLPEIMQNYPFQSVLIYSINKHVKQIAEFLVANGIPAVHIDTTSTEQEKIKSLYQFKHQQVNVLVASDIVNRGIHFDFDLLIVQYDVSNSILDLLHRFGRTGRVGKKGAIVSLIEEKDRPLLNLLQKKLDNNEKILDF